MPDEQEPAGSPMPPEQEAAGAPPPQAAPPAGSPPPSPGQQPPSAASPSGYAGYPPVVQTKTNGFAVASLVLGIVWVYWIGSVLALVFGYVAKNQIDGSGGTQSGRGMAIAGIVLGWVGVGVLLLILVVVVAS